MKSIWISLSLFTAFATAVQISANQIRHARESAMKVVAPAVPMPEVELPRGKPFKPMISRDVKRKVSVPELEAAPPRAVAPVQDWRLIGLSRGSHHGMAVFQVGDEKKHLASGEMVADGIRLISVGQNSVTLNIQGHLVEVTPW